MYRAPTAASEWKIRQNQYGRFSSLCFFSTNADSPSSNVHTLQTFHPLNAFAVCRSYQPCREQRWMTRHLYVHFLQFLGTNALVFRPQKLMGAFITTPIFYGIIKNSIETAWIKQFMWFNSPLLRENIFLFTAITSSAPFVERSLIQENGTAATLLAIYLWTWVV